MHVACIHTHLISGASAVSLVPRPEDRTRLLSSSLRSLSGPPSSPSLFCTGMLGGSAQQVGCLCIISHVYMASITIN